MHLADVHGVESGGAGLNGVEEPHEDAIGRRVGAEGSVVGPFQRGDVDGPRHEKDDGAPQHDPRVHAPVQGLSEFLAQLQQNGEAETPQDHGAADRQHDERVSGERDQIVTVEGESGVVER